MRDRLVQQVAQPGKIGEDGRSHYLDSQAHLGMVIEVPETSDAKGRFIERIGERAATRGGRRPVQRS